MASSAGKLESTIFSKIAAGDVKFDDFGIKIAIGLVKCGSILYWSIQSRIGYVPNVLPVIPYWGGGEWGLSEWEKLVACVWSVWCLRKSLNVSDVSGRKSCCMSLKRKKLLLVSENRYCLCLSLSTKKISATSQSTTFSKSHSPNPLKCLCFRSCDRECEVGLNERKLKFDNMGVRSTGRA